MIGLAELKKNPSLMITSTIVFLYCWPTILLRVLVHDLSLKYWINSVLLCSKRTLDLSSKARDHYLRKQRVVVALVLPHSTHSGKANGKNIQVSNERPVVEALQSLLVSSPRLLYNSTGQAGIVDFRVQDRTILSSNSIDCSSRTNTGRISTHRTTTS